jgi:hypothetical protein
MDNGKKKKCKIDIDVSAISILWIFYLGALGGFSFRIIGCFFGLVVAAISFAFVGSFEEMLKKNKHKTLWKRYVFVFF